MKEPRDRSDTEEKENKRDEANGLSDEAKEDAKNSDAALKTKLTKPKAATISVPPSRLAGKTGLSALGALAKSGARTSLKELN